MQQSEAEQQLPPPLPLPPPPANTGDDDLHVFTYSQLSDATDGFNAEPVSAGGRVLGAGGFGAVYKGALQQEGVALPVPVAVKTLDQDEAVGAASGITAAEQFAAEVEILSDLHHENLVKLLGFSMDGPRRCLVYALMQHGSLGEKNQPGP